MRLWLGNNQTRVRDFWEASSGGWSDLGEFPIAGFAKAERVYGLANEVPAG